MGAFRLLALAYALAVFLIAPSWIAAEEEPEPALAPAQVEVPVDAVEEAVPAVPELPAVGQTPDAGAAKEAEPEPAAQSEPPPKKKAKAEAAKSEERQTPKPDEPTAKTAATATVTISDFEFTPATVTINEGDTVTWANDGPTVHTATAEDGSFDTGTLRKGESGSATFTQAGTIDYICSPHPYMKGKVVVQAASSGTGGGSGGSTDDGGSGDSGAIAGETTTTADDGSGLPSTGGETISILLLGAATLGVGLLLRRRRET